MMKNERIQARLAAGLWENGFFGESTVGADEAAVAFVPNAEVKAVYRVADSEGSNPASPILSDFDAFDEWPPSVSIERAPVTVRAYIEMREPEALPFDLREQS